MTERTITIEKVTGAVSIGLLALAIHSCTPSYSYDAYYLPFSDTIVYENGSEDDLMVVAHEEHHRTQAHNFSGGRILWGLRYSMDKSFRCQQESEANFVAGYEDIYDHPECR